MSTKKLDGKTLLVELPEEHDVDGGKSSTISEELKSVAEMVRGKAADVIIDCSKVDIIISRSVSRLLKLHKIVLDSGHKLVLFNTQPATRGIFRVCGDLENIFEVVKDRNAALTMLNTLLVELPPEKVSGKSLTIVKEIESAIKKMKKKATNVIVDFSKVDILTGSSLNRLLILSDLLAKSGRRLIFFNLKPATKGILEVTGIDGQFEFADDKDAALQMLGNPGTKPAKGKQILVLSPPSKVGLAQQVKTFSERPSAINMDVVIDFSSFTEAVDENVLKHLVELNELIHDSDRKLILAGLDDEQERFLAGKTFDGFFEFEESVEEAMVTLAI